MCIAIIVAAGKGIRFSNSAPYSTSETTPKQLLPFNGKTFLEQCIKTFSQISKIKRIIIVYNTDYYDQTLKICNQYENVELVEGGQTRQQSVYNALQSLDCKPNAKILIHDAARPFVSISLIKSVISELNHHAAVDIALPIFDMIKKHDNFEEIKRNDVYATQTPQGFHYADILSAHQLEKENDHRDDISIYLKHHSDITTILGEKSNIKITTQEDIMENNMKNIKIKTGIGLDVHKFGEKTKCAIKICGIDVESEYKILAHSDGDVGIHAAVDAIFGALGLGDIGDHFPATDDKWKDADSALFLDYAKKKCNEMGAVIQNIDIIIICEKPKISKYKSEMQKRIAELLDISISDVNIKATTTEKLGFTGRSEGIAAQASCTIMI